MILCINSVLVNDGDYLNAVSDQSLAENVTRVLYPNDNVITYLFNFESRQDFAFLSLRLV